MDDYIKYNPTKEKKRCLPFIKCCLIFFLRSAFFFYCADARPGLLEEKPGMSVAEVAKELGKRWEHLPERAKFEAMAREDKERYEKVRLNNSYSNSWRSFCDPLG